MLAAVLHMGNVTFGSDAAEEYAAVATEDVMSRVSRLMGCDDVSGLVLQRTMKVPGAVYNIQLTPLQAQAARNAFGKAVYCLLFDWVVAKVIVSIVIVSIVYCLLFDWVVAKVHRYPMHPGGCVQPHVSTHRRLYTMHRVNDYTYDASGERLDPGRRE